MADTRATIGEALASEPGTLIAAVPESVMTSRGFSPDLTQWIDHLGPGDFQLETMQGAGFLLQFFVLAGGRIEIVLRADTSQTFNPANVDKISRDEISATQSDAPEEGRMMK